MVSSSLAHHSLPLPAVLRWLDFFLTIFRMATCSCLDAFSLRQVLGAQSETVRISKFHRDKSVLTVDPHGPDFVVELVIPL